LTTKKPNWQHCMELLRARDEYGSGLDQDWSQFLEDRTGSD